MTKMTSRNQIYLLSALLISIGLGLTLYKFFVLHFPLAPGSVRTVWNIEAKISFNAGNQPVLVSMALPNLQGGYEILDETFASSGYQFKIESPGDQRRATWTHQNTPGQQNLYYSLQVTPRISLGKNVVPEEKLPQHVSKPVWLPAQREAAQSIIQSAEDKAASSELFTHELLQILSGDQQADDVHLLISSNKDMSQADMALKLLAEAGKQAHIIRGVQLGNRTHNDPPTELIEVYESTDWKIYNPNTATPGLPGDFFIWQRGGPSLLDLEGGKQSKIRFSVLSNVIPAKNIALKLAKEQTVALVDFNIYSLPVEKQNVFKSLLLVPIGALVVVIFQILIGVRTSGTFMPVLIALAFIQTTLFTGIGILLTLVGTGLWIRSYLSKTDLHMAARIGAVLIVVVILMAGFSVASHKLGLDEALSLTFFPMVILAWTIERMSITWEEDGPLEVAIQGGGSLLVAVAAYFAMTNRLVEHLTFNFPEILLGVLGVILLIGQYTGFRLLEFYRFRHLGS
jgi:uncharacterized protein with transglutaminase domain